MKSPTLNGRNQPPLGGCVLKQRNRRDGIGRRSQPPLGGCVLKQTKRLRRLNLAYQPPLGGCVLKLNRNLNHNPRFYQPPLGGCVLKPAFRPDLFQAKTPAAFRRLRVETFSFQINRIEAIQPPLGGCVLKQRLLRPVSPTAYCQPPLGGCVLKPVSHLDYETEQNPAAFRRLRVETNSCLLILEPFRTSRL